jgi:hypothetical protein
MTYREYYPPEEYAEILKILIERAYKIPDEGRIVADKEGGRYRIHKTPFWYRGM